MNIRLAALTIACAGLFASAPLTEGRANGATIIKDPNPPKYKVEIEPKLNLGFIGLYGRYGGNSWGPGVRFSIPIVSPGFIKKLNNSVAISFGADFIHYEGYRNYAYWCGGNRNNPCWAYYGGYDNSFWSIHLPVAMQWNFFLTDKWSVFAEPGLTVRHAFYRNDPYVNQYCDARFYDCTRSPWDVYFTFYAGGRFHFSDSLALTMRIGHPVELSVGLSIFL
jgi:hypothetical protein